MKIGTPLSPAATKVLFCGAGELGKEVVIAMQRLGVETIAVDRYDNAPGMQVAHRSHTINMLDKAALRRVIEEEKPDFMSDEIGTLAKTMGAVSPNTDDPKQLAVGLRKMFDAMKDEKDADEKERRKNNLKTYMKQCGYSSTSWVDTY